MRPASRRAALAAVVVAVAVSLSGCITVYPFRSAIAASEGPGNLDFVVVVAYEREFEATGCLPPDSGSDSRSFFVPEYSEYVAIFVQAKLSSFPSGLESVDTREFDFVVADGNGTSWVEVHLRNNSTQKDVLVQGPRPGAWTLTLDWAMCSLPLAQVQDGFLVRVLVRQPE